MRIRILMFLAFVFACSGLSAQPAAPLVHENLIDASLDKVWKSWTTTDGLKTWLAPHVEIDFRIGGTMRTNYSDDGTLGDPRTIENSIISYDPQRMISMRVSKAPNDFPFPNAIYDMWTILYFEAVAPNQTRIRVVANGFSIDEESQRMRAFFDQGNAATLQQLQSRIGVRHE